VKRQIERARQRVGKRRFPDSRHVFDKQVSFGEQRDEREFDRFRFAFDNALISRCSRLIFSTGLKSSAAGLFIVSVSLVIQSLICFIRIRYCQIHSTKFARFSARK
jgi:hypothetical protein